MEGISSMDNYFKRVSAQTPTRFWINNVTLSEAGIAIEAGATGCTQNPSYSWKILNGSEDQGIAEKYLSKILPQEPDDEEALVKLQKELISGVAKKFLPMHEASNGKLGFVSIQGTPVREDKETILRHARFNLDGAPPNMMAKIPVTEDGLDAISTLAAEGVPINATECMAVQQVLDVCDVYVEATKNLRHPAPLYFSLITGIYDEYIQKHAKEHSIEIGRDVLWQAGLSVARKVHAIIKERAYPCGFTFGGARGMHHFTEMVGADACITINWVGMADQLIKQDPPVVSRFHQPTPYSVEDELVRKLPDHRKAYFIDEIGSHEYEEYGPVEYFRELFVGAWEDALEYIAKKRRIFEVK